MTVTEFARYTIKPGLNPLDPSTDEGKLLVRAVDTALSQPGAQRAYYGPELENPSHLWLFLDWDSVDYHANYRKSEPHDDMVADLKNLLDFSDGFMKHISPQPYPPVNVLDKSHAPVTEVLCAFFPPDIDAATKQAVVARLDDFTERGLRTSPDFKGVSYGWSVEDDVPVRGDEEKKGVLLAAFVGWPSLEAHMKFRDTQEFKNTIGLLRNLPGLVKLAAFHVSCTLRSK